jgi:hypothetical protein
MNVIWSFWSKPFDAHHRHAWPSEFHHLLSWVLSLETAKLHYGHTWLYTDDAGARRLVDELGLRFTHISTALNALADHDADWWTLGKVFTYSLQTEPFVHVDSDVYLWKPLPARLARAAVFAQNPVYFTLGRSFYQPEIVENTLAKATRGWLPTEWLWYRQGRLQLRGESCGIMGGSHTDFIRHYAAQSLRLVSEPANRAGMHILANKRLHAILIEEFLLAACVEYHRQHPASTFRNVGIEYLFNSMEGVLDPHALARAGFTHLMTGAKRNRLLVERLERRVERDYPEYYARCLRLAAATPVHRA